MTTVIIGNSAENSTSTNTGATISQARLLSGFSILVTISENEFVVDVNEEPILLDGETCLSSTD